MSSIILGPLLGEGIYGSVYKIKDKPYAIKYIMSDKYGLDQLGELTNLKLFDHPNILKCVDFTISTKELGIILPLAQGDMSQLSELCGDVVKHSVITEWFFQLISAIHFLHKNNFYHCDIKLENTLFIDGNVVLSDLGLLGKKTVDTEDVCQTYTSPQLMYRRDKTTHILKNKKIFVLPSNEYQDDIWALGLTLYLMIPDIKDLIGSELPSMDKFISDRENLLIKSRVPAKYIPLLLILLDPIPENRSLNLLSLLSLDLFKTKKNFVDGLMVNVDNSRPVVFGNDIDKKKFLHVLTLVMDIGDFKRSFYGADIQACDLLYRTYEFIKPALKTKTDILNYVKTLIIIVFKSNNKQNLINVAINAAMIKTEVKVVNWTDGHLSRTNISDFIDIAKYQTFIDWLMENPDKYEQYNLAKLTQIINDI